MVGSGLCVVRLSSSALIQLHKLFIWTHKIQNIQQFQCFNACKTYSRSSYKFYCDNLLNKNEKKKQNKFKLYEFVQSTSVNEIK